MDNFTFYSPTYFVFGKDQENETGRYVKRFGGAGPLSITEEVLWSGRAFLTG